MGKFTPWSYRKIPGKKKSLLQRVNAIYKLLFLLILSVTSFYPNIFVLYGIFLLIIILSIIGEIKPWELLRGSKPLFILILGLILFQRIEFDPLGITLIGWEESLFYCLRIAAAFSLGSLFFSVTTSMEIRKAISSIEKFFNMEKLNINLGISLMLSFLPRFFSLWEELNLAWRSRGGKNGFKKMKVLIPLIIERMMYHAAETALAMEARGK